MSLFLMLILAAGVLIMLITVHSWIKVTNSVQGYRQPQRAGFTLPDIKGISVVFAEWLRYVRGEQHEKQLRSLAIALAFLTAVIVINQRWLQLPWGLVMPAALILLFSAQFIYGRRVDRRLFEKAFPEVISMVSMAIASGHTFYHAMERCGEEIDGPVGNVFNRISRRLNLGESPHAVFTDAMQRFRYPEFCFFSLVMLLSMQRGGQVNELIKRLARAMAVDRDMQRRKAALTAESRFTVKFLAAVPLVAMMVMKIFSPEDFAILVDSSGGRLVLWYVIASELAGTIIVWWLLRRAT